MLTASRFAASSHGLGVCRMSSRRRNVVCGACPWQVRLLAQCAHCGAATGSVNGVASCLARRRSTNRQSRSRAVGGAERPTVALGRRDTVCGYSRSSNAACKLNAARRRVGDVAAVGLRNGRGGGAASSSLGRSVRGVTGPPRWPSRPPTTIAKPVLDRLVGADRAAELLARLT